jgi:RND family efflux transporter MFP subunit
MNPPQTQSINHPEAHPDGTASPNHFSQGRTIVYSLVVIGIFVTAVELLYAFAQGKSPADPRAALQTIPVVKVQEVASIDSTFTGIIEARVLSPMGFRVSGKVVKRFVDKGQSVKKGDPLMSLDSTDYALSATVANQQLHATEAIKVQAQADHSRFAGVVGAGAVSQQRYDAAKATADTSVANVMAAQAQTEIADNARSYTTIYAEADGVIVDTLAEPGQVVQAGQPVVELAFNDSREAVVNLPESYSLNAATAATAYLADEEATPLKAHLRQLAAQADPVLRTYEARFPIDENQNVARLGSTVTIKLSRKSNSFQVPLSALVNRGQGYEVWVFDPQTSSVSERAISVARLTENEAIVSSGLNRDEQVVSAGAHRLTAGQKINAEMN